MNIKNTRRPPLLCSLCLSEGPGKGNYNSVLATIEMGDIPVTLPVVIDNDEQAVVNRFIQASRDIAPSVQVSLAKRIIRPGSNRLVCLAAHTSIPLNEDELASVSNLALRLSDGTNVRLSLSFFDDSNGGAEVVPLSRCIYDPKKYETPRKSNFGLFWTGLALTALASFCFFLKSPVTPHSHLQSPVRYITEDRTPATERLQAIDRSKKSIALAPRTTTAPVEHTSYKPAYRLSDKPAEKESRFARTPSHKKGSYAPGALFVPPPPPTAYSPILPAAPAGFDPLQMISPLSAPSKTPIVSAKPTVTKWLPKSEAAGNPAFANSKVTELPVVATATPTKTEDAPAPSLERIVPQTESSSSGAPLPGGN